MRRALFFGGFADEVVFGRPKRLDARSAMADVSLVAVAGVTAADREMGEGGSRWPGTREGDTVGRMQPWPAVDALETLQPNRDWGSEGVRRESPDEP